jgi:hypothetical protein
MILSFADQSITSDIFWQGLLDRPLYSGCMNPGIDFTPTKNFHIGLLAALLMIRASILPCPMKKPLF